MGMRYFRTLTGLKLDITSPKPYREPPKNMGYTFTPSPPKEITLAEYDAEARDAILAHRLCDYRRRKFSLVLLPNIWVPLEDLWCREVPEDAPL